MRSPAPATGVNFAVLAVVADLDFCFAGRGGAGFTSSGASTAVVLRRQPGEMHPSVTTCGGAGQAQPAKVMDSAPATAGRVAWNRKRRLLCLRADTGLLDDRPPFVDLGLLETRKAFRRLVLA